MDASLLSSCLLVGIIALGMGWWFVKNRMPPMVMPFAQLPEDARERIARRKFFWRVLALAVFTLAVVLLFMGLPRWATLLCVCAGFFCQYRVFCLRRRYPVGSASICFPKDEQVLQRAGSSGAYQQTEEHDERMEKSVVAHGHVFGAGMFRGNSLCRGPGENENRLDGRA